jgi:hypothetical protein
MEKWTFDAKTENRRKMKKIQISSHQESLKATLKGVLFFMQKTIIVSLFEG